MVGLTQLTNYSKMKFNMLPTNCNVISHFHFAREKMMMENPRFINNSFPTLNEVKLKHPIQSIICQWQRMSV